MPSSSNKSARQSSYRRILTTPGELDKRDVMELARQLQEMIYAGEGRRGPIEKKDSISIDSPDRHTPLRLKAKGNRGDGSIAFAGVDNASMYVAKGAHLDDRGNWIADDQTAVLLELNRDSITPQLYRNTGLKVGDLFKPTSVGYVATGTSSGTPVPPTGSTTVDNIEPRKPFPHTHAMQDVLGGLEDSSHLHLHKHPHTHGHEDIADFNAGVAQTQNPFLLVPPCSRPSEDKSEDKLNLHQHPLSPERDLGKFELSRSQPQREDLEVQSHLALHQHPHLHDHGVATGLTDDDHPLYQRKHGFDLSSAGAPTQTITYDKATQKITLTPVGPTFSFWIDGVKFTKYGAQVSGAHGAGTGNYYFYYDSAGTLQVSAVNTPWSIRDRTVTPVAVVYWNNALSDGVCFYECHTADRELEIHYNLHFSRGCQYISGFDLTGYTLLTGSDAAVTYAIGSGVIADEDIRFPTTAVPDGGPYAIFSRTGAAGDWTWTATDAFPFKFGTTYPSYNQWTGATWQLTEVPASGSIQYINYFVCATSGVTPQAVQAFHIPGQALHATLTAAQAETLQGLSLGTLPFEEIAPLYRVTYGVRNNYSGTHKCQIVQVSSLKNQTVTVAGGSVGITDHGALTGLADDDHPQYAFVASPTFTGVPAAPTAAVGTSTTQLATTAFVDAEAVAKAGDTMTGNLNITKSTPRVVLTTVASAETAMVLYYDQATLIWQLGKAATTQNFLVYNQAVQSSAIEIDDSNNTITMTGNLTFSGTDPTITFASGDYITYDTTNNLYNFYVGSSLAATIKGGSGTSGACIIAKGSGYNQNTLTAPAFGQYSSTYGYVQAPSGGQISLWNDNTNSCLDGTDAGDVYIAANCSALSFTDRTPYPKDKDEAYLAIKSHEGKNGKIDHSKLHPSIKTESKHLKINRDADGRPDGTDPVEEISPGRDLSMTVSALTEVVKDLIARIDVLEKK